MVEFKKGYWNLKELEISEWLNSRERGYMKFDVETLKKKLLEDIGNGLDAKEAIEKRFG